MRGAEHCAACLLTVIQGPNGELKYIGFPLWLFQGPPAEESGSQNVSVIQSLPGGVWAEQNVEIELEGVRCQAGEQGGKGVEAVERAINFLTEGDNDEAEEDFWEETKHSREMFGKESIV